MRNAKFLNYRKFGAILQASLCSGYEYQYQGLRVDEDACGKYDANDKLCCGFFFCRRDAIRSPATNVHAVPTQCARTA